MVDTYTPRYYSTLHDSITSLCKTILPFSFKKRRLPSAEQKLSEMQCENLKWQQESFHQMLNLMGLHKEGMVGENEVSALRTKLLETLVMSPVQQEHPTILRDKLLFLQELLYAKCISLDEYHSSKRPLLQRLAIQGVEIESRDVTLGWVKEIKQESNINPSDEEWSEIDLGEEENCVLNKDNLSHSKGRSTLRQYIRGAAASALEFGISSHRTAKGKQRNSHEFDQFKENPSRDIHLGKQEGQAKSILMSTSSPPHPLQPPQERVNPNRKPFQALFNGSNSLEKAKKSGKKQWSGLVEGLKKWKRNESDHESSHIPLNEWSSSKGYPCLGEGPNTKLIKRKLHFDGSPSDFFVDKVLGEKIKKELFRIQTELRWDNDPTLKLSNEQIEAISTKLPVDKVDLENFFPKRWCDQYGDLVLDVVKKEFKVHVSEMEKLGSAARERHNNSTLRTDPNKPIW
ncbi:hypothetical protein SAY86_030796 [Trapa natans]|uniref:Uncharacterized protein n=1 Tax=Trapa natans TaxID=22666 RepID=A0AAN7RDY0_TRANT|nr:hypothetical protein SAY86_030796 [Trapa natans]